MMTILSRVEFERLRESELMKDCDGFGMPDPNADSHHNKDEYLQTLADFISVIRDPSLYEASVRSVTLSALRLIFNQLPPDELTNSCVQKAVTDFLDQGDLHLFVSADDYERLRETMRTYSENLTVECDFELRSAEAVIIVRGQRIHIGARQQLANLELSMMRND